MSEKQKQLFRQISIEKAEHDYVSDMNYARKQVAYEKAIETARTLLSDKLILEPVSKYDGRPPAEI